MPKMDKKLPADKRFLAVANANDDLHVVIRGHQLLEESMNAAIAEALPEPHALEISKLTFALKIDLGVALRVIALSSRASFVALNRLRNRFAHRSDAELTLKGAEELLNALSQDQKKRIGSLGRDFSKRHPRETAGDFLAVLFVEVTGEAIRKRESKLEATVLNEMISDVAAMLKKNVNAFANGRTAEDEFRHRLELRRKAEHGE